jgi:predicted transglutaminase-like cysteine proteinase
LKTAAAVAALMTVLAASPSMAAPGANPPSDTLSSTDYMPVGGPVPAPTGYLDLCTRSPIDCQEAPADNLERIAAGARTALIEKRQSQILTAKVDGRRTVNAPAQAAPVVAPLADSTHPAAYTRVNLDTPTMAMVVALNDRVNRGIKAATDMEVYHLADYWVAPGIGPNVRGDCEDYALEKRRLLIASGVPASALSIAIVRTPVGEIHAVLVLSARQGDYVLDNLHGEVKAWQLTGYSWISRQAPGDDLGWVSLAPANPVHMQTVAAR